MLGWPNLSARDRHPELMDDPQVDAVAHRQALRGLARINRWSATVGRLWRPIRQLANDQRERPIRVLDVGCGGGDVLIGLWKKSLAANVPLELGGCDISETALREADRNTAKAGCSAEFIKVDVIRDPLPGSWDVIYCSLFLHHFSNEDAVRLLRSFRAAAEQLVLVDDLIRSQFGYLLSLVGTSLLSRSPIVHTDGPLSVRAAFSTSEIESLLNASGLQEASLTTGWPSRFLVQGLAS